MDTGKRLQKSDGYPVPVFATRAMPYAGASLELHVSTLALKVGDHMHLNWLRIQVGTSAPRQQ